MKRAAELAKSGHGQVVALMVEAGVGKSRLFYEFKGMTQSGWMSGELLAGTGRYRGEVAGVPRSSPP
jgi:hypothetical protein